MKEIFSAILFFSVFGCLHSTVLAADLLDVIPVIAEGVVSIEISADSAMTYSSYRIPDKAVAILNITDVDPENVEPFIAVNKGAVSSIRVDKVNVSGVISSRIIFNLLSEADITVIAAPNRKQLMVTFGSPPPTAAGKPAAKAVPTPEAIAKADSPGAVTTPPPTMQMIRKFPKLEPVVPATVAPTPASVLTVKGITAKSSYIEIRTTHSVADYQTTRLANPDRLVIDIADAKTDQKIKFVPINKFGIVRARIGASPHNIRIVIDSARVTFPAYTITTVENGLRINFK